LAEAKVIFVFFMSMTPNSLGSCARDNQKKELKKIKHKSEMKTKKKEK